MSPALRMPTQVLHVHCDPRLSTLNGQQTVLRNSQEASGLHTKWLASWDLWLRLLYVMPVRPV